jgi:hypothetical protein
MNAKLKVVNPVGERVSEPITPLAPRLDTLEGKTVCEIWNGGFRGDVVFPMIEEMLKNRYPAVKIIPYTEFPLVSIASLGPETKAETLEAVRAALAQKGCDAVITGMGS